MKTKMTMKDLFGAKGKRKLVMTNAADYNTARAAEAAGIDILATRYPCDGTLARGGDIGRL